MKVELIHFLRAGYVVMFLTLFLMMWASMVGAVVSTYDTDPPRNPCSFNPLCTCSKTPPDLGLVECRYVPFAEIPQEINSSKVFSLHMEKTGLQELEPYFLRPTGLYRLEITDNPIQHIPDEAFSGLDRSLSILKLTYNRLTEIPSQAMRHLRKLQYIDLSGNVIQELRNDAWRGLEDSLQTIILAGNLIPALPTDAFSSLPLLETIDLSGNNLMEIEKDVFRDGMARLKNVIVADNLLSSIPYSPLAPLKALRMLDLSYNRISTFAPDEVELKSVRLNLNALHLEYNQITSIPPESFGNFDVLNMTYLDGNPINVISEGAFKNARIRELYMRNCKLHYISPEAFVSLESSLQVLDMSGNNITNLPEKIFSAFDSLKILSLRDNKLLKIVPTELFMALQPTLHKLDLTGDNMPSLILQDLRRLRNLRSLAISRLAGQSIGPEDFLEYGYELEDLKIYKAGLRSIRNHAFREIRTIKRLDLSENNINSIENDAFREVGHSLLALRISRGLSMDSIPVAAFKALKSLEELDLTNNRLSKVPDTSFHNLKNLRVVEMHDNMIDQLSKGTFQGDLHHNLEIVSFAFNSIRHVSQHTFVDLKSLKKVRLEDNKIERIERKAFMNLDKLRTINLRGNKINSISDEAFQIYENDPLPKGLCESCELFIYATHEKLVEFNKAQQNLVSCVTDVDYLNGFVEIKSLLDRIQGIKARQALQNIAKQTKVKTLTRICIDFFNKYGPSMLDTYLKCDNIPSLERNVRKRSHKRVAYKGFGDKKRKRAPLTNAVKVDRVEKPKKLPPEPKVETQEIVSNDEGGPATRRRSRALSRVNYVDDIPDSVLFYDEIQAAKRRKLEEKVILESIKVASKHPNHDVFQTNPYSQIQINAAVSIPMMEFDSTEVLSPEIVYTKSQCRHCGLICDNLKILAIHNMQHLSVRLQKIGEKMTLPANLRRGVMFREDRYRVVRCTSCLQTFRNADQIKEHWNSQNCDFYCKICYASFHQNPERIDDHLFRAHGVRRQRHQRPIVKPLVRLEPRDKKIKIENDSTPPPASGFKLKVKSVSMINASAQVVDPSKEHFTMLPDPTYDKSPNLMYTTPNLSAQIYQNPSLMPQNAVRAVCHICNCSFPNINSRNSHMKAHKQFMSSSSMSQMPSPYTAMPQVGPSMDYMPNYTPCGFVYYNRAEFLQHRSECKDCRYACMVCSKPFQAGSELQMHMMLQHPRSLTFKR